MGLGTLLFQLLKKEQLRLNDFPFVYQLIPPLSFKAKSTGADTIRSIWQFHSAVHRSKAN